MCYTEKEQTEGSVCDMRRLLKMTALFCAALCALPLFPAGRAQDGAALTCLNIGKADCMLLQYRGKNYLIDTGYEQTYAALETMLRAMNVSSLDGVFLTHTHKDHAGGLEKLAESAVPVAAWYASEIYYDVKPEKHPMYKAAKTRGQDVTWLRVGDTVPLDEESGFRVLGPVSVNEDNENNNSLVLQFYSLDGNMLLAGDMKEEEEGELLAAGAIPPCAVLKVGHHGDNKATTDALLRAVRPQCAVILTASFEEPDTPAPETLARLRSAGAQVYVSQDMQDALRVTLSGGQAAVEDVRFPGVPERQTGLTLTIDMQDDLLTLQNASGETVALSGCALYSSKGDDMLPLPDFTLAPGQTYRVGSRATDGAFDLKWDKKRVWHETKRDLAILYDAYGRPVAWTDNGKTEE